MEAWATAGATIAGRTTYDLSIPYWGADGPIGPARVPTVVVSHSVPQNVPAGGVYTFVDSVEAALETAKKLAGDKEIGVAGVNIASQFIKLGLIDEIIVHIVPVLFGSGTRLVEDLGSEHVQFETIEVIHTPEVTHMRFRVVK